MTSTMGEKQSKTMEAHNEEKQAFDHKQPTINDFNRQNIFHDTQLGPCYDILQDKLRELSFDSGKVWLIDCYPRLCPLKPQKRTMEYSIVRSARISFDLGLKDKEQDDRLVRYLIKHKHTSPLETIKFTFKIKVPIAAARQILRHRMANINEVSGRYSEMKPEFYHPKWKTQSKTNKQASNDHDFIVDKELDEELEEIYNKCYSFYKKALDKGVSRELARFVLPLSLMTEFYFTMDLNNLFKFFDLRLDTACQEETRQAAQAMFELIQPLIPVASEIYLAK